MSVLAYCLMPQYWHLVWWPAQDSDLSELLRWLTITHTQRGHAPYHTAGSGPLYQGRFQSFPLQADDHLLTVCRYVERNALRARLVERTEAWRCSSLWQRVQEAAGTTSLDEGPVVLPSGWVEHVNQPETEAELTAVRRAVVRGAPFGGVRWQGVTARRPGLQSTWRRGRPRQADTAAQDIQPQLFGEEHE